MARGKKTNFSKLRQHGKSLNDLLRLDDAKIDQERVSDPIAPVPDYTNPEIRAALNQYLALDMASPESTIILQKFIAGEFDFENFAASEHKTAYTIYDALQYMDNSRADEMIKNARAGEDVTNSVPLLFPKLIDYRFYLNDDQKILAEKEHRVLMKEYSELVSAHKQNSGKALALRKNLEDCGYYRDNTLLLMEIDSQLDFDKRHRDS